MLFRSGFRPSSLMKLFERMISEGIPALPARSRFLDASRGPDEPLAYTFRRDSGGEYPWSGIYPYRAFPKRIFYLDDVVGNKGLFNPVKHVEMVADLQPMQPWFEPQYSAHWTLGLGFGASRIPATSFMVPIKYGAPPSLLDYWQWLPYVSPAQMTSWSIDALNKFSDQVPTSVSVANFLYELKDMKGMIPSIDRRGLSKTVSNNFLAFEFGVKPFISDIKAMVEMSDAVDKRLKHLLDTAGKSVDLRFDRELDLITEEHIIRINVEDPNYNSSSDNFNGLRLRRTSAKVKFHCGAKLFQDLQGLSDSMSKLKALAASGGFNHPARVIWNAIPYSFVVDWFFSIGKILDSISIQPFGGEYRISDVGWSLKREATYIGTQVMANGQFVDGNATLGTVRVKDYVRQPGFPATSLLLTDGQLSPKQLVLGLAMLEQKRR